MSELVLKKEDIIEASNSRDKWLGVMSAFAIAWYSFCLLVFVMMVSIGNGAMLELYSDAQLAYLSTTPFWVKMANAISIMAGLTGSIYLLLRRSSAYYWFALCLFALLAMIVDVAMRGGFKIMSPTLLSVSFTGFIVGLYLFWASYSARNDGELNAT